MKGPGFAIAVAAAIAVLGGLLIWYAAWTRRRAEAALAWPTVEAVVSRSVVATDGRGRRRSYTPEIAYSYQIAGHAYEGGRLRFGMTASYDVAEITAMIAPYPVGGRIKVHVDPANPALSVVEPKSSAGPLIWLGGFMIVAGAALAIGVAATL